MPKEPGEPNVAIALLPEGGVRFSIDATFTGSSDEWSAEMAGAWLAGLWERTLSMAHLIKDYHVVPLVEAPAPAPPPAPLPEPEPPARSYAALQEEARQQEREKLTATIERAETNGNLAPAPAPRYALSPEKWEKRLLSALREAGEGGMSAREIQALDPQCTPERCKSRLQRIRDRGQVTFVSDGRHHASGRWHLASREAETEADPGTGNHLSQVLPYTRGKTILVLGGDATPARVRDLQATFQAKELRWPTFYDQQPVEWRLREIRKADVDLVLCTRWNRRYGRQYQHAAREWEKPFVMLTRGINPTQVTEQLYQQWVLKMDLPERVAA